MTETVSSTCTAVVLAADRGRGDPVAALTGAPCKALAPVGGTPMLLRVLDALEDARSVARAVICGPPPEIVEGNEALQRRLSAERLSWTPAQSTPSLSVLHALAPLLNEAPVLLTTADHALLTPSIVDYFWRQASRLPAQIVAGVASCAIVTQAFPQVRRTPLRFRDGAVCGCNLFAFKSPDSLLAARFWRRVEQDRKRPLRIARALGWMTVLRYLSGRLSLNQALGALSKRIGVRAATISLPFPEAAIDVDTPQDWHLVEHLLTRRTGSSTDA